MRRRISMLIVVLVFVLVGGLGLSALSKVRGVAAQANCQNNLRQLGMAVGGSYDCFNSYPPAVVPNDKLACNQRLSWLVDIVPFAEQMYLGIDRSKAWDADENRVPTTRHYSGLHDEKGTIGPLGEMRFFRCPANPVTAPPDAPGLTDYVGVSGIGSDAAERSLGYPGVGFFGCNRKLKREDITDGTGNTFMVLETNKDNGPWTAGGFPTVRGLDPAGGSYLGKDGQFGSGHRSCNGWFSLKSTTLTHAVFADGSVRSLSEAIDSRTLEAWATIAGGEETGTLE